MDLFRLGLQMDGDVARWIGTVKGAAPSLLRAGEPPHSKVTDD
jgi:hypothetical protein